MEEAEERKDGEKGGNQSSHLKARQIFTFLYRPLRSETFLPSFVTFSFTPLDGGKLWRMESKGEELVREKKEK